MKNGSDTRDRRFSSFDCGCASLRYAPVLAIFKKRSSLFFSSLLEPLLSSSDCTGRSSCGSPFSFSSNVVASLLGIALSSLVAETGVGTLCVSTVSGLEASCVVASSEEDPADDGDESSFKGDSRVRMYSGFGARSSGFGGDESRRDLEGEESRLTFAGDPSHVGVFAFLALAVRSSLIQSCDSVRWVL